MGGTGDGAGGEREVAEIEEARAAHEAQETVSDTEIEFQPPIESKVKPLKIYDQTSQKLRPRKSAPSTLRSAEVPLKLEPCEGPQANSRL